MRSESAICIILCPPKWVARRRTAGIGTSPAVLTTAVWALTHQKKPVVPDEIAMKLMEEMV